MEQGLASSLASNSYGSGSGQSTKHHYSGTINTEKRKSDLYRGLKRKKKVDKPK